MSDQPPKSAMRRTPPPQEPDKATQLKSIMEQIAAATGDAQHVPAPITPQPAPPIAIPVPPPTAPEDTRAVTPVTAAALAQQPPPVNKFLEVSKGDVVQVVNRDNQNYGVLFIVGDVQGESVHGFWLTGTSKEFVTVSVSDLINERGLALIGKSRVLSHNPTSPQWQKQYGQTN